MTELELELELELWESSLSSDSFTLRAYLLRHFPAMESDVRRRAKFTKVYQSRVICSFKALRNMPLPDPAGTPPCHVRLLASLAYSAQHSLSFKIVLINLIRHDHHPQQKHRPDDIKRKRSLPVLTYPLRLQPR